MKQFFKSAAIRTALYYTILIVIFSFTVLLTNSNESSISLDPSRILMFVPFCLSFAVANTLLRYKQIEAVTRWMVHFTLTVLSAFLFIILPAELPTSSGNFIGFVLILVIYFVGVLLNVVINKRIRNTLKEDKLLKAQSRKRK